MTNSMEQEKQAEKEQRRVVDQAIETTCCSNQVGFTFVALRNKILSMGGLDKVLKRLWERIKLFVPY